MNTNNMYTTVSAAGGVSLWWAVRIKPAPINPASSSASTTPSDEITTAPATPREVLLNIPLSKSVKKMIRERPQMHPAEHQLRIEIFFHDRNMKQDLRVYGAGSPQHRQGLRTIRELRVRADRFRVDEEAEQARARARAEAGALGWSAEERRPSGSSASQSSGSTDSC